MSVEIAEIKEALEQIALKEPYFLNKIIKISLDNITTKDDLKMLVELMNKRFEDLQIYMNKRFEDSQIYMNKRFEEMQNSINKRFEDVNKRFEEMQNSTNKRFEDLQKYMDKRFEDTQKYMDRRFSFMTRLIVGFNIPLLLTMIGLLLNLLLRK